MSQEQQWNPQYYSQATTQGYSYNTQPQTTQVPQQAQSYYQSYPYQNVIRQQPVQAPLPFEQSSIENILRLNRGKIATVYMTYENNSERNAKVFTGRVEQAGRDHLVLSDVETGTNYLLLMANLDYVTFNEPIEYQYPTGASSQSPLATYSPR
ncbi:spore coat protein GerQ [bacterium LRH843]|nr:spore coat protein GerQ [bacterium LRH843]